ncbi:hypothetical protein [Arachidicoccus ginsenosidivorans]|jgi:hypothetical protein|uniref:hypothetical protein n=1 Tax=Arachidicoccus ginsenosidivorans TaxID=496057 RepID=UPI00131599FC|nr:hypothetical protein [Arachidicoccus ginsenosidivorans]
MILLIQDRDRIYEQKEIVPMIIFHNATALGVVTEKTSIVFKALLQPRSLSWR